MALSEAAAVPATTNPRAAAASSVLTLLHTPAAGDGGLTATGRNASSASATSARA